MNHHVVASDGLVFEPGLYTVNHHVVVASDGLVFEPGLHTVNHHVVASIVWCLSQGYTR